MVTDNPPSYDYATQDEVKTAGKPAPPRSPTKSHTQFDKSDVPPPAAPLPHHTMQAGPSYIPRHDNTVHHYVNPLTGEHVISVLPPHDPEMVCLQEGRHIRRTKFGLLGVLAAVFWFPLGIGLCLLDRRVTCERCGHMLEDGVLCG